MKKMKKLLLFLFTGIPIYHLIQCLNKIALLDSTCTLMGDFNIDLLKSHENNVPSKFLEIITSCFLFHLFSNGHTQVKNLSKKKRILLLTNLGLIIICEM